MTIEEMPKPLVSAGILVKDITTGLYLMVKPYGGTTGGWGIPKGKRDKGERILPAAIREVKEETGLDFSHVGHIVQYHLTMDQTPFFHYEVDSAEGRKNKKFHKHVFVYKGYAGLSLKDFPFECTTFIDDGRPEIAQFGWFTLEECHEKAVKSQKGVFQHLLNYKKYDEEESISNS